MRDLFRKHKLEVGICIGSIIPIIVIVLTYVYYLKDNGISGDPANWAHLGDYIGGLLGPIFGFFSFILLLFTLKLSYIEKESIERREKKEEWLSLIKHVEMLIRNFLNNEVEIVKIGATFVERINFDSLLNIVTYYIKSNYNGSKDPDIILQTLRTNPAITTGNFIELVNHFESYTRYIEKYSTYLLETDPAIIDHYLILYAKTIVALDCMGLLSKEIKDKLECLGFCIET